MAAMVAALGLMTISFPVAAALKFGVKDDETFVRWVMSLTLEDVERAKFHIISGVGLVMMGGVMSLMP